MKLSELKMREPQHLMLFGDSKSGKSTLVSKLAAKYKLIWLSLDNGHRVLYKLPPEQQENIDIIVLPDTKNFPVAIDTCRKLFSGDKVNLCHMHSLNNCTVCKGASLPSSEYCFKGLPLDTIVVLDHATQLTDSCLALITKGKPVDYKLQLDDWGALRFNMVELMSNIQQAPFNIVVLAQSMESEMEDGKKKITPHVGSSTFGKSVGSFFDHIIYTSVLNKSHRAGSSTTYSATILTGSRSDIEIEKDEAMSLIPFFDGTIGKKEELLVDKAKSILNSLKTVSK